MAVAAGLYFITIAFFQHDFGSGVVLFVISYCILMIPPYKELKKWQNIMTLGVLGAIVFLLRQLHDEDVQFLDLSCAGQLLIAKVD